MKKLKKYIQIVLMEFVLFFLYFLGIGPIALFYFLKRCIIKAISNLMGRRKASSWFDVENPEGLGDCLKQS